MACRLSVWRAGISDTRRAQPKHGAGQMFRGVDVAFDAQNLLRAGNAHVVDELMAEVREAGAKRAPESAVSQALRVPPCRFRQRSGARRAAHVSDGGRIASMAGLPSKTARKRSSTMTATRRSGRARFRMSSAGVVRTQSPSERSRRSRRAHPAGVDRERCHAYSSIFASSTSMTGISSRMG